ncbi:hypothetical protein D3C84_791290 [compost metagenome]
MTTFSPHMVGRVLTRISMDRLREIFSLIRPSWGRRRSAISSRAITFKRAAKRFARLTGGVAISCSMPSIRKRILYLVS